MLRWFRLFPYLSSRGTQKDFRRGLRLVLSSKRAPRMINSTFINSRLRSLTIKPIVFYFPSHPLKSGSSIVSMSKTHFCLLPWKRPNGSGSSSQRSRTFQPHLRRSVIFVSLLVFFVRHRSSGFCSCRKLSWRSKTVVHPQRTFCTSVRVPNVLSMYWFTSIIRWLLATNRTSRMSSKVCPKRLLHRTRAHVQF